MRPRRVIADGGVLRAVEFERTRVDDSGRLIGTGETLELAADMLFKAIGQSLVRDRLDGSGHLLEMDGERIAVDEERRTSIPGVWAGGDCVAGGKDLTVVAVEDGKRAAISIDRALRAGES
jgi:glutamate synthase (NADPH/NADH) small chain